jgi:cytochrome c2
VRRYLPTFILLLFLLLVGGLAVANAFGQPATTRGPYVPTLSADPATAALEGWIFFLGMGALISGVIVTGIILAITFYRLTKMMAAHPAVAVTRSAAPKSNTNDQGLPIPFSSTRSVAIFWIVVVLLVVGFQALRYLSQPISVAPFGYVPSLSDLLNITVLRLPGQHIAGLPSWIAGPGDDLKAIHLFIAALGMAVVGVAVVGFGLAQGFARLDTTVREANKYKGTLPDRLLPVVEQRIEALRAPRPKRLPGNPIDGFLVAVNVLLFLVIASIIVFYVIPSYSGVAAVDNAIAATQIAGQQPPPPTPGAGEPSPAEINQTAFDALPAGNADAGQTVFQGSGGCSACHSLVADQVLVGPSQHGIAERAPTRKPGYSAQAYLYESITNPNAYIVEGFAPNLMPQNFKETLQPQQLADVIAFLLTQ